MSGIVSRLRKLGWKKWLLIMAPIVIIILVVVVVVPAVYYHSRDRKPVDYSETLAQATAVFSVTYDSGDGLTDDSTFTRKVIETGLRKGSHICFREVTEYDPYPRRKVSSILGSLTFKLGTAEIWRDQGDLRVVEKMSLETDLPFLNTLKMISTYSRYVNYPGWPYHLGDSWTYQELATPDSPVQKAWTNTWQADVVSDNAMVQVGDKQYQCFEVVHTLTDTTNPHPSGAGIGGTIVEYWYGGGKTIGPIKQLDSINFKGTEIQTMTGDVTLSVF